MWQMILNHILDSEAASGPLFSIRPNPFEKLQKMFENCQNVPKFQIQISKLGVCYMY